MWLLMLGVLLVRLIVCGAGLSLLKVDFRRDKKLPDEEEVDGLGIVDGFKSFVPLLNRELRLGWGAA